MGARVKSSRDDSDRDIRLRTLETVWLHVCVCRDAGRAFDRIVGLSERRTSGSIACAASSDAHAGGLSIRGSVGLTVAVCPGESSSAPYACAAAGIDKLG